MYVFSIIQEDLQKILNYFFHSNLPKTSSNFLKN